MLDLVQGQFYLIVYLWLKILAFFTRVKRVCRILSLVETLLRAFFAWLIYPGFLFLFIAGIIIEGLLRRFAGRVEGREGPGLLQGFFELGKLLRRPATIPAGYEPPEDD